MTTLHKLGTTARWAKVLMVAFTLVTVGTVAIDVIQLTRIDRALSTMSSTDIESWRQIASLHKTIHQIALVIFISAGGFFIAWMYSAYKNVSLLGAIHLRRTAGWAIGAWFIPIMYWIWPKEIVNDTWRASDPALPAGYNDQWKQVKVPGYVHWWWAFYIVGGVFTGIGSVALGANRSYRSDTVVLESFLDISRFTTFVDLIGIAAYVIACYLCFKLIDDISQRQRQRLDAVGIVAPPTPAPAPGMPWYSQPVTAQPAAMLPPPAQQPPPAADHDFRPGPGRT